MVSQVFRWEELRELAFGSIGASYVAVGTPFGHPALFVQFYSTLDQDVIVSWRADTDHHVIPAGGQFTFDVGSDKVTDRLLANAGTQVEAKQGAGGAPSSGSLFLSVGYSK